MELGDFLKRELSNGSPWNCSTLPADWAVARGHPDFAAEWRDIVDATECEATPRAAGGLLTLWERGIGDGLPFVRAGGGVPSFMWLEAGDIAVVAALGLEAGAIWTGERWAVRAARGLHFIDWRSVSVLKAWRP